MKLQSSLRNAKDGAQETLYLWPHLRKPKTFSSFLHLSSVTADYFNLCLQIDKNVIKIILQSQLKVR